MSGQLSPPYPGYVNFIPQRKIPAAARRIPAAHGLLSRRRYRPPARHGAHVNRHLVRAFNLPSHSRKREMPALRPSRRWPRYSGRFRIGMHSARRCVKVMSGFQALAHLHVARRPALVRRIDNWGHWYTMSAKRKLHDWAIRFRFAAHRYYRILFKRVPCPSGGKSSLLEEAAPNHDADRAGT